MVGVKIYGVRVTGVKWWKDVIEITGLGFVKKVASWAEGGKARALGMIASVPAFRS